MNAVMLLDMGSAARGRAGYKGYGGCFEVAGFAVRGAEGGQTPGPAELRIQLQDADDATTLEALQANGTEVEQVRLTVGTLVLETQEVSPLAELDLYDLKVSEVSGDQASFEGSHVTAGSMPPLSASANEPADAGPTDTDADTGHDGDAHSNQDTHKAHGGAGDEGGGHDISQGGEFDEYGPLKVT
jgi:hypothetical protein